MLSASNSIGIATMGIPEPILCTSGPAMGIPSPVRSGARQEMRELQQICSVKDEHAEVTLATPLCKVNVAILLCRFAGGPPAARVLAASCKTVHAANLQDVCPSRLYVVGGLDSDYRVVDTVERYDPLTGSWESLPSLKSARAGSSAVAIAGRLYIIGGEASGHALNDVHRFDPWLNRWESLPSMHHGRIRAAAADGGGCLFVLGGLDGTKPLTSVECFDTRKLAWQDMPSMTRPRYAGVASSQAQWIFAIGGELTDAGMKASIERYDRKTGLWELMPSVQQPCCGAAMTLAASGRAALTFGGLSLSGQALSVSKQLPLDGLLTLNSEEEEDSPRWSCLPPMPTARHLASAAPYRGGAVAVGGKGSKFEAVRSVEFFNPENWNWEALPPLPSPRLRAAVVGGRL
mmetsp:Transcript_49625/g.95836  ORF Transcript_49625/g.95836 Transcript_49625/m.95836 type:complete len:404 (-) Transcript_49625:144-1355(-)